MEYEGFSPEMASLKFSVRAYNALLRAGYTTVASLTSARVTDFEGVRGFGPTTLGEVAKKLRAAGLSLRGGKEPGPEFVAGRCENCHFWDKEGRTDDPEITIGTCHRNAPVPILWRTPLREAGDSCRYDVFWPQTVNEDWCGEFQPRSDPPS